MTSSGPESPTKPDYVLAHQGEDMERRRLALLTDYHGPLTLSQLRAAAVAPGWRCLEVGAGSGALTAWLAHRAGQTGHVLAVDLETHWLKRHQSRTVEVRQADITTSVLPTGFDLVLAQMLLLHLPDPARTCRQLLEAASIGGQLIIHDADFTTVALGNATEREAAGLAVMTETMNAAGVHLALGPRLEALLVQAGAAIEHVESQPSSRRDSQVAARITAITLQRFRDRAVHAGADTETVNAAIHALQDPERTFIGPTRWIVRCRRCG